MKLLLTATEIVLGERGGGVGGGGVVERSTIMGFTT